MSRVALKQPAELEHMRRAGRIVRDILDEMEKRAAPGVTTQELDALAADLIRKNGAQPAFKGYGPRHAPFPACVCISLNEEVVHGIPSKRAIRDGDLLKLDFGVSVEGWFADSARTVCVGSVTPEARKLAEVTKASLAAAIRECVSGNRLGDIGHAVQSVAESNGFSVVRDFSGHGIGTRLHEPPSVPNFGSKGSGIALKPGMTIAIEPMVNAGTAKVEVLDDEWTAVTLDRKLSAHFEHTVLITENSPEILTA